MSPSAKSILSEAEGLRLDSAEGSEANHRVFSRRACTAIRFYTPGDLWTTGVYFSRQPGFFLTDPPQIPILYTHDSVGSL